MRNHLVSTPLEGELTVAELSLELDSSLDATHELLLRAKRKYKYHYSLWRFVFDTDLDARPDLALDVVNACRSLIAALDKRERAERRIHGRLNSNHHPAS